MEEENNSEEEHSDESGFLISPLNEVKLKPHLTLSSGLSIVIGIVIGSGIFASPKVVMENSGSVGLGLIVWAACGIGSMMTALCYLELGLMLPESGAEYVYLKRAFGRITAFTWLLVFTLIIESASLALVSITFGHYIIEAFNPLCQGDEREIIAKVLALFSSALVAFINSANSKLSAKVQVLLTVAKVLGIAIIVAFGIVKLCQGSTSSFRDPFVNTSNSVSDIAHAFYGGLFAYNGWSCLTYVTEEIQNPRKVLPQSLIFGVIIIIICYLTINISYLTALTPEEVKKSNAVAMVLSYRYFGKLAWIVPLLVACSCLGSMNGAFLVGSRLFYVGARDGVLPRSLTMLQRKTNTPIVAIIVKLIIPAFMLLPKASNFSSIVKYYGFLIWIFYGLTVSGLLWLRYKEPKTKRPYKVPIFCPIIVLIFSTFLTIAPIIKNPLESFIVLSFVLTCIPIYLIFIKYDICPRFVKKCLRHVRINIQRIGDMVIPSLNEISK